jgi:hypothetical protein
VLDNPNKTKLVIGTSNDWELRFEKEGKKRHMELSFFKQKYIQRNDGKSRSPGVET